MSPREALYSPVVHFYLALVFGLLLVAGVPLALLRHRAGHAWRAYRGWLIMVPLVAAAMLLGRESAILFFTAVGLLGFREFARATALADDRYLTAGVYLGIVAAGAAALVPDFDLFMTLPAFVVAGLLAVPVLRDRTEGQLRAASLAVLGFVYLGWGLGHVAFLANANHAY